MNKEDGSREEKICLNCGRSLTDEKYCPQCGQSTSVGRLTTKNFLAEALAGLTRLNRGFLYTCWRLLISPWRVISDYIRGRRKNYSGPVQTLIVLCFLALFLDSIFGTGIVSTSEQEMSTIYSDTEIDEIWRQLAEWYLHSPTFQYLIIFIPTLPAFMLVTKKGGEHLYNWAEGFVAAIYTSSSLLMVCILVEPLTYLSSYMDSSIIPLSYIFIMGSIGVYKALRPVCATPGKRIWRFIGFLGLSAFNYFMLVILIGLIIALTSLSR